MHEDRLVVVSNRLAVVLDETEEGWKISSGSGGLVTALSPVLKGRGGVWIGWLGTSFQKPLGERELEKLLAQGSDETGYTLKPVDLTPEEIDKYYFGFSNEILWPLFHDLSSRCNFDPEYWDVYQKVNAKFARTIVENTEDGRDFVWVHDYQLLLVAREMKRLGARRRTGFFLHIPFPPLDGFLRLPWRFDVLEALLEYDLVGFQTMRDRRNFVDCARTIFPDVRVIGQGHVCKIVRPGREVLIGAFPISIDFKEFAERAVTRDVENLAWIIHANLPDRQLILGIDRLDYTKGIPNRLLGFANALERYPELRRKVTFIQVVVPSRETVTEYEALKREIERLVGEISGRYTEVGWTPIHYIYGSLTRDELVAYYRTCEIALVTPLKDGMNLVAKEYCAASVDDNGVLILSEFAGAAAQLNLGAILVNPYDLHGVGDAIYHAMTMDDEERRSRMKKMRRSIRRNNIYEWVNSFLRAAIAKDLLGFPRMEFYVPRPGD